MTDFIKYNEELKKISKFATDVNFDKKLSIIRATCKNYKHIMLVEEDFASLKTVYDELADLEIADLSDYMKLEKELWTIQ